MEESFKMKWFNLYRHLKLQTSATEKAEYSHMCLMLHVKIEIERKKSTYLFSLNAQIYSSNETINYIS